MNATLTVERIERRLSIDMTSDAEWLRTETQTFGGELQIVDSMRYSDETSPSMEPEQVQAWIAEDHRRYTDFQNGEWWFRSAQARNHRRRSGRREGRADSLLINDRRRHRV